MKLRIEQALQPLIGLPLWTSRRAADLQAFHFGEERVVRDRNGEEAMVGSYALHVQCAWRLRQGDNILVGSADLYVAAGDDPDVAPEFDWDRPGANRRDERIESLFGPHAGMTWTVSAVAVEPCGGIRIEFENEMTLDVFPNNTFTDEYWRLFQPSTGADHVVVGPHGIGECE